MEHRYSTGILLSILGVLFLFTNVHDSQDCDTGEISALLDEPICITRGAPSHHDEAQGVSGTSAPYPAALMATAFIRRELDTYPPDTLSERCRPEQIRLVSDLRIEGRDVSGLVIYSGPSSGTLLLSIPENIREEDEQVVRRTFAHELFHLCEMRNDDVLELDETWHARHHGHAQVYYGSRWRQAMEESEAPHPHGFARGYGMYNAREDRATMAEVLLYEYEELEARMQRDRALTDKAEDVRSFYHAWFGLSEEYFVIRAEMGSRFRYEDYRVSRKKTGRE